jgi:Tol biopolymer transport system component
MRNTLNALGFLFTAALVACSGGGGAVGPGAGDFGTGGQTPGGGSGGAPPPSSPPSAAPSRPPVGTLTCNPCKKIVFMSAGVGDSEIYSINADGTALTRLTDSGSYDGEPAWSPDGQKIAFTSDRDFDGTGPSWLRNELYVMDADGGNVTRLTFSRSGAWHPTWSADGTWIAYESISNGSGNLWQAPASGGTPMLLFSSPGFDGQPAWSPDGTRLALVSDWFAYDSVTDIFLINADGTGFTAVTDGNISDQLNYEEPAWSPDGVRIALTVRRRLDVDSYATRIGVANASGSNFALLETSLEAVSVGKPTWSPDGTTLAYTSCDDGRCDVSWIKADGSARGEIVRYGRYPDWQR